MQVCGGFPIKKSPSQNCEGLKPYKVIYNCISLALWQRRFHTEPPLLAIKLETQGTTRSLFKPRKLKIREIPYKPVGTNCKQRIPNIFITNGNYTSGIVLTCQTNRGRTILDQQTVLNIYIQPTSSFQMHCPFVKVSAIIVNNILFFEPTT